MKSYVWNRVARRWKNYFRQFPTWGIKMWPKNQETCSNSNKKSFCQITNDSVIHFRRILLCNSRLSLCFMLCSIVKFYWNRFKSTYCTLASESIEFKMIVQKWSNPIAAMYTGTTMCHVHYFCQPAHMHHFSQNEHFQMWFYEWQCIFLCFVHGNQMSIVWMPICIFLWLFIFSRYFPILNRLDDFVCPISLCVLINKALLRHTFWWANSIQTVQMFIFLYWERTSVA